MLHVGLNEEEVQTKFSLKGFYNVYLKSIRKVLNAEIFPFIRSNNFF